MIYLIYDHGKLSYFKQHSIIYFGLLIIISAAITPGIHPHKVRMKTIIIDPQPLSITANGGNMIDKITLQILIYANLQLLINL